MVGKPVLPQNSGIGRYCALEPSHSLNSPVRDKNWPYLHWLESFVNPSAGSEFSIQWSMSSPFPASHLPPFLSLRSKGSVNHNTRSMAHQQQQIIQRLFLTLFHIHWPPPPIPTKLLLLYINPEWSAPCPLQSGNFKLRAHQIASASFYKGMYLSISDN